MTADAKVGLLLGLFFIVIIAFLVNGLPNFIEQEKTTAASNTIVTPIGPDMMLDNSVPEAVHRLYPERIQQRRTPPPQEMVVLDPPSGPTQRAETSEVPVLSETPVIVQDNRSIEQAVVPEDARAKRHVVKSGEILPVIAKKYYGEDQGNRRIVIQKLYEANTAVLKSPDRVRVGDKLVIPLPLEKLLNTSENVVRAPSPSQGLLGRFPNLLERVGEDNSRSVSEYVVQKDDSLWSIAQKKLGDGNRYKEIVRLNKIKDADTVDCGVRLKIPAQ